MIFKLYDCDVGLTINGTNYEFDHVAEVTIENPEKTRLIRGANAKNKTGLDYKEGIKDAHTISLTVIGLSKALHALLVTTFNNRDRVDGYIISRADGSSKKFNQAVISQSPQQLTLNDAPESLNTILMFESFDVSEVHTA